MIPKSLLPAFVACAGFAHAVEPTLPGLTGDFGWVPQDVALVDANRDGRFEVAVAYAFSDTVAIFAQDDTNEYRLSQNIHTTSDNGSLIDLPRRLVAADFTGDGWTDLLVVCSGNPNFNTRGSVILLRGTSTGRFERSIACVLDTTTVRRFPTSACAVDLNGDGYLDAAVANGRLESLAILANGPGGSLHSEGDITIPVTTGLADVETADLNNDGKSDLLILASNRLWYALGNGTFHPAAPVSAGEPFGHEATALAVGDVDGDGRLDAVVAGDDGLLLLFRKQANTTGFFAPQAISTATDKSYTDVHVLDWDGDGDQDIVAVARVTAGPSQEPRGAIMIFRPGSGAPPEVRLCGKMPRRAAIGSIASGLDVIAADEGDESASENLDLPMVYGPAAEPVDGFFARPRLSLDNQFPGNVGLLSAATIDGAGTRWLLDGVRRDLVTIGPSESAAPARVPLPMTLAGASLDAIAAGSNGGTQLFGYQREDSRVRCVWNEAGCGFDVHAEEGENPRDYRGLALRPSDGGFFVCQTTAHRISLLGPDSSVRQSWSVPFGYDQLAYDGATNRLFAASAGQGYVDVLRPDMRASISGDPRINLASLSPRLQNAAIASMGWNAPRQRLEVFLADGSAFAIRFTPANTSGSPQRENLPGHSRGAHLRALAYDEQSHLLYGLDAATIPEILVFDAEGIFEVTIPLGALDTVGGSVFRPAGLDVDPATGRLILVDERTARFVEIDSTGAIRAQFMWNTGPGGTPLVPPFSGLAIDDAGFYLLRTAQGIVRAERSGAGAVLQSFAAGDAGDIECENGQLLSVSPNARRVDEIVGLAADPAHSWPLGLYVPRAGDIGGLALNAADGLAYVAVPATREIVVLEKEAVTSAAENWQQYE